MRPNLQFGSGSAENETMVGRIWFSIALVFGVILAPVSFNPNEHRLSYQVASANAMCAIVNSPVPSRTLGTWELASIAKGAVSCAKSALDGAWNEVQEMRKTLSGEGLQQAASKVGGAASCIWSPIACAQDAAQAARNTYNFVADLGKNLGALYSSLSASELSLMVCSLLGAMGPKMIAKFLLGLVTGGAAMAAVALDIKKLFENLDLLQKLVKPIQAAKLSFEEVLKLPKEKLAKFTEMKESMGPERFGKEVAVCAAH